MMRDKKDDMRVYGKYMVIGKKTVFDDTIYGIYETEIEALRRYRELKNRNAKVVKGNIQYTYINGHKFVNKYEIIE